MVIDYSWESSARDQAETKNPQLAPRDEKIIR
jgi:hypothetical protein